MDVLAEIERQIGIIMEQALIIEFGGVVKSEASSAAKLAMAVPEALFFQPMLRLQHLGLGRLQRIIQTA